MPISKISDGPCPEIQGAISGSITSDSLYAFLQARRTELVGVMEAANERHQLAWEQQKEQDTMDHLHWMFALRIASGDALHTPNGSTKRVTTKLSRAAEIDPSMQSVLGEWHAALERVEQPRGVFSPDLLARVMEVCSGAVMDEKAIAALHEELCDTDGFGESSSQEAFYEALRRQGYTVMAAMNNGISQFAIKRPPSKRPQSNKSSKAPERKREKLTASA
jgi:hypothetical protein